MTPSERFEAMAAEFYRDTGITAPGKDVPAGAGELDLEMRRAAWNQWIQNKRDVAAAKARLGGGK